MAENKPTNRERLREDVYKRQGLIRLAEIWSAIRAKEGMGGLVLEGTEAKILSDVVAQFYAYLSGCMFNDPVGCLLYTSRCV